MTGAPVMPYDPNMVNEATPATHVFERSQNHPAPFRVVRFHVAQYQACPEAPVQPGETCAHCGTAIMNVYTIQAADGYRFPVGCDCVAKTGDAGLIGEVKAAQAERRRAASEARRIAREEGRAEGAKAKAAAWLAANPDYAEAFALEHPTVQDIRRKAFRYGVPSPAQLALVMRFYAEALKKDAPGCAEPPPVPVPDSVTSVKRAVVEARILGTRVDEGPYGTTLKALYQVRTPEGAWKAWGTVPQGAWDIAPIGDDGRRILRGLRLRLRAGIERSDKDPAFAFIRRPTVVAS